MGTGDGDGWGKVVVAPFADGGDARMMVALVGNDESGARPLARPLQKVSITTAHRIASVQHEKNGMTCLQTFLRVSPAVVSQGVFFGMKRTSRRVGEGIRDVVKRLHGGMTHIARQSLKTSREGALPLGAGVGEAVKQRGFAHIGHAHQGDARQVIQGR